MLGSPLSRGNPTGSLRGELREAGGSWEHQVAWAGGVQVHLHHVPQLTPDPRVPAPHSPAQDVGTGL